MLKRSDSHASFLFVSDLLDDEIKIASRKLMEKEERKKEKKNQELILDEILPKATGREALFEKKMSQKQAAKAREFSPEPMAEKDIMGGGDDFQARFIACHFPSL